MNKPLPPSDVVRTLAPNETWSWETSDWFYISKTENIDEKSKPWTIIQGASPVWLKVTFELWPKNLEPHPERKRAYFGEMLQRSWQPFGDLQLGHVTSDAMLLDFSLLTKNAPDSDPRVYRPVERQDEDKVGFRMYNNDVVVPTRNKLLSTSVLKIRLEINGKPVDDPQLKVVIYTEAQAVHPQMVQGGFVVPPEVHDSPSASIRFTFKGHDLLFHRVESFDFDSAGWTVGLWSEPPFDPEILLSAPKASKLKAIQYIKTNPRNRLGVVVAQQIYEKKR